MKTLKKRKKEFEGLTYRSSGGISSVWESCLFFLDFSQVRFKGLKGGEVALTSKKCIFNALLSVALK